jgi:hypothetical protein
MPLRVRRGTNADRQTITPDQGELIYTIDTKRLYIGDGINAGGLPVTGDPFLGIDNIVEDTSPELGGNLSLNSFTVNGTGAINIQGGINATSLSLQSGEGTGLGSNLIPTSNNAYILGNANKRFKNLYTTNINIDGEFNAASVNADIVGDDSTILIDSATSRITTSALAQASATDGQVLKWNNGTSTWTASDQSLSLLSDVDATNPQNNQVLTWNSTAGKWQALAAQGGGGGIALTDLSAGVGLQYNNATGVFALNASINDLTDVTTTSPTAGQTLVWNPGSNSWINDAVPAPVFANITDIDLSLGVLDNDFLQYDGGSTSWKAKTLELNDISNVDLTTPPTEGQVLLAGSDLVFRPANPLDLEAIITNVLPSVDSAKNIGLTDKKWNELYVNSVNSTSVFTTDISATGTVTGNVTGNLTGNVTGNVTGNLTGTVNGDVTGSVFGDDSTVLVDGVANSIVGKIDSTAKIDVTTNDNIMATLTGLAKPGAIGPQVLFQTSTGTVDAPLTVEGGTTGDALGEIQGSGYDGSDYNIAGIVRIATDLDSTVSPGVVPGRVMFITANSAGNLQNLLLFNSQGYLGLGTPRPDEKLHVNNGNAKIDGFVQFGSLTSTERDALTPVNGMVIYNSTNDKFEGRQGGAWINLDDGTAATP